MVAMETKKPYSIVKIPDGFSGLDKKDFTCGKLYDQYIEYVIISEASIRERTKVIASEIHRCYGDVPLRLLCVLNGAVRFFALLVDELYKVRSSSSLNPIKMDFVRASSYLNTKSTNTVQIIGALDACAGENVLIVEDIVDTGLTVDQLIKAILQKKPLSVRVVSLLVKRVEKALCTADFAGFEIPNRFVIGFGLDYNNNFRELNHIGVINDAGIEKFKE